MTEMPTYNERFGASGRKIFNAQLKIAGNQKLNNSHEERYEAKNSGLFQDAAC